MIPERTQSHMNQTLAPKRKLHRELLYRLASVPGLHPVRQFVRESHRFLFKKFGENATSYCVHTLARLNCRMGRVDAAVLNYGWLILKVPHVCRETMDVYRRVDALIQRYPQTLAAHRVTQQAPQKLLFFVGHPRSGHSLVGSLLDAHPNVIIANELAAHKQLHRGASVEEVMRAIKYNSYFHAWFGRTEAGYNYRVPGQYQGHTTQLTVLGDKKGNDLSRLLQSAPEFFDDFEARTGFPFVLVHVIRNPYDNIATKAARSGLHLSTATRRHFDACDAISKIRARHPESIVDVYTEDLIASPESTLCALCERIGIDHVSDSYLQACASILFKQSQRTALKVTFSPTLLSEIEDRLAQYPFLERYRSQDARP